MLRLALVFVLLMSGTAHALPLDVKCRVPGVHDADVIRAVHAVGLSLRVSDKVMLAGFEAGWVESHMNNLACGDRDSLGVFQQRPSMGWGTPEQIMDVSYAARRFFEYAVRVDRPDLSPGLLADAVQRSCCPERYDQALGRAESMLRQAWQGGPEVVGGVVHVVEDGDVWSGGRRLSTSGDFVGRPSVAGLLVYARTARGEVRVVVDGAWRVVASGVGGDPEAVVRPDGTVEVYAVLADGSVNVLGQGWQPLSPPAFATGKPSAIAHPDGSVALYVRSGDKLMASAAGTWRELAAGLDASPEAVLRPDGTVAVHALINGRPHRLTTTWEPLSEARFIDTVSAEPDGAVYARTAEGKVLKVG
ncbi:hypothetical protein ACFWN2_41245 [Lentzea sp. NPDC058436]|uniref:hypothetical protein n=1 Tax=Lentzea sp. NPDC058436 TaxID=3346499 RepID=UPI00366534C7